VETGWQLPVSISQTPTTANAGTDETICSTGSQLLSANNPSVGAGAWSVYSGPSTSSSQFSSTTSPTATFTPAGGAGTYVLRWTISNAPCTASISDVTITVTETPSITSVTNSSQTVQYSDPITNVMITGTPTSATTSAQTSKNGGAFASGLPSGLTLVSNNDGTWTLSGRANVEPTVYTIRVTLANAANASCTASTDITLTVNKEDATITYTGNEYYTLPSATATSFNVSLSATVKDITAVTTDSKYDPNAGNITNAKVVFHLNNINGTVIGTSNVSLVDANDIKVGVASAVYNCPISSTEQSSGGKTLTVYAVVENISTTNTSYYTALSNNPTTITISCPGADYVTGGGYLLNSASRGTIAGTSGLKTNFGFTMKYNKTGGSPKGQCNIIVRSNGKIYQIKANAINTLSIGAKTSAGVPAYFNTKANYTDITNPLSPISLGGNLDLTLKMNDVSTGGQGDQVSILLQNPVTSELIFSSNWNGTQTVLQNLGGGNVRVRNTTASKAVTPDDAPIVEALTLKAFPNPSSTYFTLNMKSRINSKVQVKVVDLLGRPVYLTEGSSNQAYRFGDGFASGSYLLQVTQGDKKQVHKLIKLK
jgi:hypothetical protein